MQQNRIIGVIATKGSGKTYTVADYLATQPRFVVFDLMKDASYLRPGETIIEGSPRELAMALQSKEFRIVYRPQKIERDGDTIRVPSFDYVVDACYETGNMLLVIDEAHLLCDAHHIPMTLFIASTVGRHQQLSIIYISQSFSIVHNMLKRNTDEFWFWRIIDPADLKGIEARCGEETREKVRHARKLEKVDGKVVPGERVVWTVEDGLEGGTDDPAQA